jgi:hypothetical protein
MARWWSLSGRMPTPSGFKARPSAHSIEVAPSSRARCRRCAQPIAAGTIRLRTTAFVKLGRSAAFFRHATAACITHAFALAVVEAHGGADRVPISGRESTSSGARVEAREADVVRATIAAAAMGKPERGGGHENCGTEGGAQ